MAQHHLDASQVGAGFEKVRCKRQCLSVCGRWRRFLMPARMVASRTCLPDDLFGYRFVRARVVHSAGKQVGLGSHPAVVFAQCAEHLFAQGNFPVDAALALNNAKHHSLAVDVSYLKATQLGAAQASRVEGHQNGSMIEIARCADQLGDFLRTEDHRQSQTLLWIRQILLPYLAVSAL